MSIETTTRKAPYKTAPKQKKVSIETFLEKYRKGGPGVKYEYNKGIIEKTETMKSKEQHIFRNLQHLFDKTTVYKNGGLIVQEMEVWTSENQWRKPDVSYISSAQIEAAADGFEPVPEFMIEVISKTDKINEVKNKVKEYFKAGVKLVWHIFPALQQVEIYYSANKSETFIDDEMCSAAPIIEDFTISVNDIFKKK